MTILHVDTSACILHAFEEAIPCAIGRAGAIDGPAKREGDAKTPLGLWPIRAALLRPDRVALSSPLTLPWRWLRPDDGWSDDAADPEYNRPITHPHRFSAERLWREDELYDAIVVLGHNDAPPVAGQGSAIFLHCREANKPTLGCVAIEKDRLLALLPRLRPGDDITIT